MTAPSILLIDDEPPMVRSLHRLLACDDYCIHTCTDPREAIPLSTSIIFSVVISDYHMPHIMGDQVLKMIINKSTATTGILLSGHAASENVTPQSSFRMLTKPWDDDEVRMMVRHGVERFKILSNHTTTHATTFNNMPLLMCTVTNNYISMSNTLLRDAFPQATVGTEIREALPKDVCQWLTHTAHNQDTPVFETNRFHFERVSQPSLENNSLNSDHNAHSLTFCAWPRDLAS